MTIPASFLRLLGGASLLIAGLALLGIPFGWYPTQRPLDSYLFVLVLLAAVSFAIWVAARLQERNDPLAARAVPSSLAAYLLFILVALRWLMD